MSNSSSASPVMIEGSALLPRGGIIEGAVSHVIEAPVKLEKAFFLPDGEVLDVPAGTAFQIKGGKTTWYMVQFFRAGTMTGPVTYTETEIEPVRAALHRGEDYSLQFGMLFFVISFGFICMLSSVYGLFIYPWSMETLIVPPIFAFGSLCVAMFTPIAWIYGSAILQGGDRAIDLLYRDDQKSRSLRIPLGTIRDEDLPPAVPAH